MRERSHNTFHAGNPRQSTMRGGECAIVATNFRVRVRGFGSETPGSDRRDDRVAESLDVDEVVRNTFRSGRVGRVGAGGSGGSGSGGPGESGGWVKVGRVG